MISCSFEERQQMDLIGHHLQEYYRTLLHLPMPPHLLCHLALVQERVVQAPQSIDADQSEAADGGVKRVRR